MNTPKSVSEIKAFARAMLPGHYTTAIAASLISDGLYLSLMLMVSPMTTSAFATALSFMMYIILQLLMGILDAGSAFLYMNIIYRQRSNVSDIFHNFKEQPDKAIRLQLLFVIIGSACYLPMYIYILASGDSYSFATRFVLMLIGYAAAFIIRLQFSQVFYLLQDFPGQDTRSLISGSVRLMQGNILRLLMLTLSFIPLFIVSALTFFIPMLWLGTYYRASLAAFYSDLMEARSK